MILQTGGRAIGATSTRSRSCSCAMRRASPIGTMPICSPSAPTRRTSGMRIRSLIRGSTLMGPPRIGQYVTREPRLGTVKTPRGRRRTTAPSGPRPGRPEAARVGNGVPACERAPRGAPVDLEEYQAMTVPDDAADALDGLTRDLAEVPAVEVVTACAVNLMSAAAVKLGLAENGA